MRGKPHIERMLGSVATMFAQYVSGYTGREPGIPRAAASRSNAVWSLPELQDLLDQWLIAAGRTGRTTGCATRCTRGGRSARTRSTPP